MAIICRRNAERIDVVNPISTLDRIRRTGRIMRLVVSTLLAFIPLAVILSTLVAPNVLLGIGAVRATGLAAAPEGLPIRLMAFAAVALHAAVLCWGLWHLRSTFAEHVEGRIFSGPAARHFRLFATASLIVAATRPLLGLVLSIILTLEQRPQHLAISISSDDVLAILISILFLVIARIMEEGARLADENASFV